ncbi:hypothetical protein WDU99_14335 [Microbacterium sp. Mu-80]|uniref:Uncharacterized protein n=1 Tax=Microbacterium bandirmense TaxID=3122050 RepID=A0ABU8LEU8_9MICO
MPETIETTSTGLTRRRALKVAAWSVPALTVALAAPASSASESIDLMLAPSAGGSVGTTNPEGTRQWQLTAGSGWEAYSEVAEVPAGTVLTVSSDIRILPNPVVTLMPQDEVLTATSTSTTGNMQTSTYTLPAIPPGGYLEGVPFTVTFDDVDPLPWAEDLGPFTVSIAAPAGVNDPDTGNNLISSEVVYSDIP